MTQDRWAALLWGLFALTVFAVVFDWGTRMAGYQFVFDQQARAARGLPLETIEAGFRPLVHAAAERASLWMLVILGIGTGGLAVIARTR
jgi:uncharacterized membrane protein